MVKRDFYLIKDLTTRWRSSTFFIHIIHAFVRECGKCIYYMLNNENYIEIPHLLKLTLKLQKKIGRFFHVEAQKASK